VVEGVGDDVFAQVILKVAFEANTVRHSN
jgi:hypothetical protein